MKKLFLASLLVVGSMISMSADYKQNPFTLAYDGAITQNIKGNINIQTIKYKVNGIDISANIYTPANYNPANIYPTIVVAHPNGSVKEQVAGLYAQKLAEQGYITIVADAAYQGASGGTPRNTDKPANRVNDIHGMADYILTFPGVDQNNLGLLGICGGGGYSIKAAQTDKRFKVVATISMFNTGVVRRDGYVNSQLDSIQERLKNASDARLREAISGKTEYPNSNFTDMSPEEAAKLTTDLYREGYEYYAKTHVHPNSTVTYPISNLIDLAAFDAVHNTNLIKQPLLMIAGEKADSLYMTEDVFKAATGAKDKELYIVKGATHIQTYWKPEFVKDISEKLTSFYNKNLKPEKISVIKPNSLEALSAGNTNFSGNVFLKRMFSANNSPDVSAGVVMFKAGSRTAWHTHPKGQMLIITEGRGWIQQWGESIIEVQKGDVVWFPAGVKHWHGGTPDSDMTNIAIAPVIDGRSSDWLEKVTDEQYKK